MQEKKIVCALLINSDNHILLQDRKGISKYGEEWSFFGGSIEPGEDHEEALKRELGEELDWTPEKYTFLGETEHHIADRGVLYHRYVYFVPLPNDKAWLDREGSGAHFFRIEDVQLLKFNTSVESELLLLYNNI